MMAWVVYEFAQPGGRGPGHGATARGARCRAGELLRLQHTGWIVTYRTLAKTQPGPWTLPDDTDLAHCRHALHRDRAFCPDPLKCDPDQWLDGAQSLPPGAPIPWGAGKQAAFAVSPVRAVRCARSGSGPR